MRCLCAQVMVATVRCEEIANEKFAGFIANEVNFLNTASRFILFSDVVVNNLV